MTVMLILLFDHIFWFDLLKIHVLQYIFLQKNEIKKKQNSQSVVQKNPITFFKPANAASQFLFHLGLGKWASTYLSHGVSERHAYFLFWILANTMQKKTHALQWCYISFRDCDAIV